MAENNNNKPQVRVASIEVELGMSVILFMTWGTGIDQEMRLILPLSPECYQVRSIKECMSLIRDIMILTQKRLY